jgi:lysyl-tRNA synthetase class 1
MASVVDITQENPAQMDRVVRQYLPGAVLPPQREELARQLSPRLDCAINYTTRLVPADSRTVVRASFNHEAWAAFDDRARAGVRLLLRRLEDDWTIDGLTKLLYAIPKLSVGLPEDAAPSPELKAVQRRYFAALYKLLCSADTGPRLPTLLMSVGAPRVRELLTSEV